MKRSKPRAPRPKGEVVKFRISRNDRRAAQAMARKEGVGLSELIRRSLSDRAAIRQSLNGLASSAWAGVISAEACLTAQEPLVRELASDGSYEGKAALAMCVNGLGHIAHGAGDLSEARRYLTEARALLAELNAHPEREPDAVWPSWERVAIVSLEMLLAGEVPKRRFLAISAVPYPKSEHQQSGMALEPEPLGAA